MTQPPQGPWHGHGYQQGPGPNGMHGPPGVPQYGQYPGYGYPPPPPPNKSKGPIIAICLAVATTLVIGVTVLVVAVSGDSDRTAEANQRDAVPPAPSSSSSTTTRSSSSTTKPSSSRSSAPSATGGNAPGSASKVLRLGDHPMLQDPEAGLQNRACNLPAWRSDQASAQAFFTAAGGCLDAAWGPFLEAYDLPFVPPQLHFPTGPSFETACGTIQVGIATAAYYCENNLYVPFAGLQTSQYGNNPGVYLALFAHEYGHHVQEVAGVMDAAWDAIYRVGQDSPAGLEMARRKELQAQCFSGMFLGAHVDRGGTVSRDMYDKAWNDQETRGDNTSGSKDHGTNQHYAKWWRDGAKDNRIVDCNTFSAAPGDVS